MQRRIGSCRQELRTLVWNKRHPTINLRDAMTSATSTGGIAP